MKVSTVTQPLQPLPDFGYEAYLGSFPRRFGLRLMEGRPGLLDFRRFTPFAELFAGWSLGILRALLDLMKDIEQGFLRKGRLRGREGGSPVGCVLAGGTLAELWRPGRRGSKLPTLPFGRDAGP